MSSSVIDPAALIELEKLVEELTHSGQKTLDETRLKKLKSICKQSSTYIERLHSLLMEFMEKDHAEIRFSAFQLCDEFFRRSHLFRELIIEKLPRIFALTAEVNAEKRLPPPKQVANDLKKLTLKTVKDWNSTYGPAYKKLTLGFNFLKKCAKINFERLEREDARERELNRQIERKKRLETEAKLIKLHAEISENEQDIRMAVNALDACLSILIPRLNDFSFDGDDEGFSTEKPSTSSANISESKDNSEEEDFVEEDEANLEYRERGMSTKYALEISVSSDPVIHESAGNKAVLENATDQHKLLSNRFLSFIKSWEIKLSKIGKKEDLERIIDLRKKAESVTKKFQALKVVKMRAEDEVSTDSELEDVPLDETLVLAVDNAIEQMDSKKQQPSETSSTSQQTNGVAKKKKRSAVDWSILSVEEKAEDPTSAQASLQSRGKNSKKAKQPKVDKAKSVSKDSSADKDSERKKKLLAIAPKLPYDIDLYHWEDGDIKAPTMIPTSIETHRFWSSVSADEMQELPAPDGAASLRTRVIEFTGKFEPVKWECRAPLPSGQLCPRKDRVKCPLHGKVVGRDKTGRCTDIKDEMRLQEQREKEQQERPDWQDPVLLAELKKTTGVDLKMPERTATGRLKRKAKKYPGLTDLKQQANTSYRRLSKKVFKKSTMMKVARALDRVDQRKYRDKFGDQFHYMYDSK